MSSLPIQKYFQEKSIKLSDSFMIELQQYGKDKKEVVYPLEFSIPTRSYSEDFYKYGNGGQTFLIPNYNSLNEVSITVTETDNCDYFKSIVDRSAAESNTNSSSPNYFGNMKIEQSITTYGYAKNLVKYHDGKTLNEIIEERNLETKTKEDIFDLSSLNIFIMDNSFNVPVYAYKFQDLVLLGCDVYTLDYNDESPAKLTFRFGFERFSRGTCDENTNFAKDEIKYKYGDKFKKKNKNEDKK